MSQEKTYSSGDEYGGESSDNNSKNRKTFKYKYENSKIGKEPEPETNTSLQVSQMVKMKD